MAKNYPKMSTQQRKLVALMMNKKQNERRRSKWHDYGARSKTTYNYFRPIKRGSDEGDCFRDAFVHRFIRGKVASTSLFPRSKEYDVICLGGENACPVCAGVELVNTLADYLESKGQDKRAAELRRIAKSAKAKQMTHWVAVTYDEDGEPKNVEKYRLSSWFFEQDFLELLTEKSTTLSQWIKKNPKLKRMAKVDQEAHYLENCPPMRGDPDDAKAGWKFCVIKSGDGLETKYKAKFEEDCPFSGEGADKEAVKLVKTAIKDGSYPSLDDELKTMSKKDMIAALGPPNKNLTGKKVIEEEDSDDGPDDELTNDDGEDITDDSDTDSDKEANTDDDDYTSDNSTSDDSDDDDTSTDSDSDSDDNDEKDSEDEDDPNDDIPF